MELHIPEAIRGGVYVVGYFDLLGQSNALTPFVNIEGSQDYVREVQRNFARIASQLLAFRSDIKEFFNGAQSASMLETAPPGIAPEVLDLAAQLESEQVRLQGFSDTVIAYVPTGTESGIESLYRIGAMLMSVSSAMLFSLARGTIVRGAIDASWAMELSGNEIYGPALMCAYKLESEAGWPRVVLGPGIQTLWRTTQNMNVRTTVEKSELHICQSTTVALFPRYRRKIRRRLFGAEHAIYGWRRDGKYIGIN